MRLVVKLGTSTLTDGTARLHPPVLIDYARQIARLQENGHQIVLVSSGAIAAGREALGFPQLPRDIPAKQMLAAVGQPRLMALYEQIFGLYGLTVGQVLLTRADLTSRRSYLNARNALLALLSQRIIPIVNENDTVATEEIRVGDNDNLSALVANLIDADWLILLTDQSGLFTADPRIHPEAELIPVVSDAEIPPWVWEAASGGETELGVGGMLTKIQAADLARRSGTTCIIASGKEPEVLLRLLAGEQLGTRFEPVVESLESRKRYILSARRSGGAITADEGAVNALRRGGSLLPVGIVSLSGNFERGDTVRVLDPQGRDVARGIVNYPSRDLKKILRRRSDEIEAILGYHYGDEVIHHNDLALL